MYIVKYRPTVVAARFGDYIHVVASVDRALNAWCWGPCSKVAVSRTYSNFGDR